MRLAKFMEDNPTITFVSLQGDPNSVRMEWLDAKAPDDIDQRTLESLAQWIRATKIDFASRQGALIEFYGGYEIFMGRHFEAWVIKTPSLREAIEPGKVTSCQSVNTLSSAADSCIELLDDRWAIRYLWFRLER